MNDLLTPDEDVVFRELLRLDVEPNQIPPDLYAGFLQRLADTVALSLPRTRAAIQGLIDKGKFDISDEVKEERVQNEREIIRDLLLHDAAIQEMLRNIVTEICAKKRL